MTTIHWRSDSHAAVSAPALKLYVARVVAAPQSEEAADPQWLGDLPLEHWRPVRLEWPAGGRPSTLTVRRILGAGAGKPQQDRPEADWFRAGDRIRLVQADSGGQAEWFRGYVAQERLLIQSQPDGEVCEAVAYGPEILLKGRAVMGQWHAAPGLEGADPQGNPPEGARVRANVFRSHLPVVFNEWGAPNASAVPWRLDAGGQAEICASRIFEGGGPPFTGASSGRAVPWTAGCAVQSLIEMTDGYAVVCPASAAGLPRELFDLAIGEVNVEGLSLPDALQAVLQPIGWGFALEPWAVEDGRHALRTFPLHGALNGSRVRRPYLAPVDGTLLTSADPEARRVEVQRIEFIRDNHNVVNDVTVVGDQKRKQVVLAFAGLDWPLKPAWDTSAHDLARWATEGVVDPAMWPVEGHEGAALQDFEALYAYGSGQKTRHAHAFRSFTWNEDGAFDAVAGRPGDLAVCAAADGRNYVLRPRPVGATFLRDDADAGARDLAAFVQLGVDGDEGSWVRIPAVIWRDRAGFTIPVDPLWGWYPFACEHARHCPGGGTLFERYGHYSYLTLLHNALQGTGTRLALRLVGSVECDEAVTGRAARRVGSSWPMVSAGVIRAENRFRRREAPPGSDILEAGEDRHDVRDDSSQAADYAAAVRDALEDEVGHGSITLRRLTRAFAVGDVVPGTEGRTVDLTVRGGRGAYAPLVVGVVWNFEDNVDRTELLLDTSLLRMTR